MPSSTSSATSSDHADELALLEEEECEKEVEADREAFRYREIRFKFRLVPTEIVRMTSKDELQKLRHFYRWEQAKTYDELVYLFIMSGKIEDRLREL